MITTMAEVKEILRIAESVTTYDSFITKLIPIVQAFVIKTCRNNFVNENIKHSETIVFDSANKTMTDSGGGFVEEYFVGSTDVCVSWSYHNNGNFTVKSGTPITDTVITVDESLIAEDTDIVCIIRAVQYPEDLKLTVANMVYSQLSDDNKRGISSKKFESFSVSYASGAVDESGYMKSDLKALKKHRKM